MYDPGKYTTSEGALYPFYSAGGPDYYERRTATWGGNARVDYLLPNSGATVTNGGVYWPLQATDPVGYANANDSSDHRMVWIDLVL